MGAILEKDLVPVGPCKVRAIYSWSGEDKRDLGFVEGDIIEVLNTGDGNWWTGRLKRNKLVGLFPRNFVEFTDPNQEVMSTTQNVTPSIADLGISDPLGNSQGSKLSTKSAEEILEDIGKELNVDLGESVALDIDPDELLNSIGSRASGRRASGFNASRGKETVFTPKSLKDFNDELADETEPLRSSVDAPVPPPHKVMSKSISSNHSLSVGSGEQAESPNLEDIPFDPKSMQLQPPQVSSSKTGPVIRQPSPAFTAALANSMPKFATHTTPVVKQPMLEVSLQPSKSTMLDVAGKKFMEKLLPKNTKLRLKRSTSHASIASARSFRSIKSTTSRKLKSLKNIFSFDQYETSLYPTNDLHVAQTNINVPRQREQNNGNFSSPGDSLGHSSNRQVSGGKWIINRRDLYRAKTLNNREREERRQAMELQGISCDNPVAELELDGSREFHDYRLEDHSVVDDAVLRMSTWPQLMTPAVLASSRVGRHFDDTISRLRAVFLICTTRIEYNSAGSPDGGNIIHTRKANARELAECVVAMCTALGIEAHTVDGHFRSDPYTTKDHTWTAVKVEGEWRMMDVAAASPTFTGDEEVSQFYFLTPPHELIYSHVPTTPSHQYLGRETLATSVAVSLPLAAPAAFAHKIMFSDYSVGMTRLKALDVCELTVNVPNETTDVVALVDDSRFGALAQPLRSKEGTRQFRLKSFVPCGESQATLRIYAVSKSQLKRTPEEMELVWTLPLRHTESAKNAPFQFVSRYATPQAPKYDIYILEPQCRELGGGENYTFKFEHHPCLGETKQPRLAVQSPSGRITKLIPRGTDAHDTGKVTVKTLEVGTWRAVLSIDDGESWVPFGEWYCS